MPTAIRHASAKKGSSRASNNTLPVTHYAIGYSLYQSAVVAKMRRPMVHTEIGARVVKPRCWAIVADKNCCWSSSSANKGVDGYRLEIVRLSQTLRDSTQRSATGGGVLPDVGAQGNPGKPLRYNDCRSQTTGFARVLSETQTMLPGGGRSTNPALGVTTGDNLLAPAPRGDRLWFKQIAEGHRQ